MRLSAAEITLVDRWQRNFPLVERPFAVVGRSTGFDEATTIEILRHFLATGVISRIGAVVRPHTAGASTLAAMRVPEDRLEQVATIVNAESLVNHNYQREHDLNVWFVVAGPNSETIAEAISRIERGSGIAILDLPLIKAYHVDLGFPLGDAPAMRKRIAVSNFNYCPDRDDRFLLSAIENGLPLVERPYQHVGRRIGIKEGEVIGRLQQLSTKGVISRFGCVVRHRSLGYTANAMAVWNVPDEIADAIADRFVENPRVTLCYRRPRRLPEWPYNLFCMVHARSRDEALTIINDLNVTAEATPFNHAVLFSTRCFKQRGAVFSEHQRELH
jgi:DNA-binding Lrp family transcriptional regulator